MLGKHYLCAVVKQEAANWPTANARDWKDSITGTHPPSRPRMSEQTLGQAVSVVHGQAAPARSSSGGSRQGLSEPSQQNWQTFAHGTHNRGETPHRQVVKALVNGEKVQTQMLTVDQVFAEEIKGTNKQLWPTITAHTPDMESNGPNGHSGTYLAGAVKAQEQKDWRTPTVAEEKNQNTSKQIYLQNQVGAVQKQWGSPAANDANKTPHCEVNSNQAGLAKSVGLELQRQWATPRSAMASMHPEYGEHWNDNRGGESIATQVWKEEQWGTPTARDHKSGRGNEDREYKELTPMVERTQTGKLNPRWVETLMGLPVGWVMPSCKSPVTIAPTNSDSSETESCQPQQNELF